MARYLVRRVLWALFLFLAVTVVTYVIFFVTPADPARLAAGQGATPAQVQEVAQKLHLNDPLWKQYGLFLKQLVVDQSLGESFVNRRDVNDIVGTHFPKSMELGLYAFLFAVLIGVPLYGRAGLGHR